MYNIDTDFKQIEKDYNTSAAFQEYLHDFADQYVDDFEGGGNNRLDKVYFVNGHIHIQWVNEESLEIGSTYMTGEAQLAVEYLWNPNWKFDLHAERYEENIAAMQVQAEKQRVRAERDRGDRYKKYLELQKEFGDI